MNLPAAAPAAHLLQVAVSTPAHSALGDLLSYACDRPLPPGTLVRVPLGRRELGVVWDAPAEPRPARRWRRAPSPGCWRGWPP
jgi:primosomal protein N' (replication factor Y)